MLSSFKFNVLRAYEAPTSDYKETESKVVDLAVSSPLKKGDLVVWTGDGKTCQKATGDTAKGVLTAGEFEYRLSEWKGGHHVQVSQRGKKIIPSKDLPSGTVSGDDLTIKAGVWAKVTTGDKIFGSVGEKLDTGFIVDLSFLG